MQTTYASPRTSRFHLVIAGLATVLLALTAIAATGAQDPAVAQTNGMLIYPDDPTDPRIGISTSGDCADADVYVVEDAGEGSGDEPIDVDLDVDYDPVSGEGSFSIENLPAGEYDLVIDCFSTGGEFLGSDEEYLGFARLTTTKVVEGDAPEGATFLVEVVCDGSDGGEGEETGPVTLAAELSYDRDGGDRDVYFYDPTECEISEPEDGGAESVDISAESLDIDAPEQFDTTVTNTFPEAEESEEAPPVQEEEDEDDEEEPEDDEEEDLDEAEPAEAVEEEPDYTG